MFFLVLVLSIFMNFEIGSSCLLEAPVVPKKIKSANIIQGGYNVRVAKNVRLPTKATELVLLLTYIMVFIYNLILHFCKLDRNQLLITGRGCWVTFFCTHPVFS